MTNKVCLPGDLLFSATDTKHTLGTGTYSANGKIYASVAGILHIVDNQGELNSSLIEVRRSSSKNGLVLPAVGAIVTARVIQIGQKFSRCSITSVGHSTLNHPLPAILRKEDLVPLSEGDKVEMHQCVRPNDVILAKVIGFGGETTDQSYLLSIADDLSLGVVSAISEQGHKMVPVNWKQMRCTVTDDLAPRKVAHIPHIPIPSTTKAL